MICDGGDAVVVFFSSPSFLSCPQGTKCVVQPNKTGICIVPPAGYAPPGMFVPPPPPPERPALTSLLSFENMAPIRPGGAGLTSTKKESTGAVGVGPAVVSGATESAGGIGAEVAECKSILQSGKVSWGGGTSWAPGNIDKLCNGTKSAKDTIACFQSNRASDGACVHCQPGGSTTEKQYFGKTIISDAGAYVTYISISYREKSACPFGMNVVLSPTGRRASRYISD
jgi:hypothetical protein